MNIVFRKIDEKDLEMTFAWRQDEDVSFYLPKVESLEKQYEWWKGLEKDKTRKYRIVNIDGIDYAVFALVNIDYSNRRLEIGGFIPKKYHGLKFGTNTVAVISIKCMQDYIFNTLNFNKIVATVPKFNLRALKLDLSCGFEIEGILKDWFYHNGKFHDDYILSLLKKDWKSDLNYQYTFDE